MPAWICGRISDGTAAQAGGLPPLPAAAGVAGVAGVERRSRGQPGRNPQPVPGRLGVAIPADRPGGDAGAQGDGVGGGDAAAAHAGALRLLLRLPAPGVLCGHRPVLRLVGAGQGHRQAQLHHPGNAGLPAAGAAGGDLHQRHDPPPGWPALAAAAHAGLPHRNAGGGPLLDDGEGRHPRAHAVRRHPGGPAGLPRARPGAAAERRGPRRRPWAIALLAGAAAGRRRRGLLRGLLVGGRRRLGGRRGHALLRRRRRHGLGALLLRLAALGLLGLLLPGLIASGQPDGQPERGHGEYPVQHSWSSSLGDMCTALGERVPPGKVPGSLGEDGCP
ncbi:hypothetical protein MTBUT4_330011 [Magnetospirillum sp. UT-4]|nr:hypothetical protein MTBUT4_330011 [Magnetospirillum sp. UT-4]